MLTIDHYSVRIVSAGRSCELGRFEFYRDALTYTQGVVLNPGERTVIVSVGSV